MLFDNTKDIQTDIYHKMSNFLMNNTDIIDIKHIISLLRSYLSELKNIKEIDNYQAEIDKTSSNTIIVEIRKDIDVKYFTIDIDMEIRRLKINKIKSSDRVVKNFLENNLF